MDKKLPNFANKMSQMQKNKLDSVCNNVPFFDLNFLWQNQAKHFAHFLEELNARKRILHFFLQLHIFVSFTAVAQERRTGERGFSTIKVSRTDSICHGSNQPEMMHCIGAFFSLVADKQGLIKQKRFKKIAWI